MSYDNFMPSKGQTMEEKIAIEYIKLLFETYNYEKEKNVTNISDGSIPINIISLYDNYINKRNFKVIFQDYKEKFITNESIVEPGVTPEEKLGLGKIYDYISNFKIDKPVNVFIESMQIHNLLYSCCPFPEFGSRLRSDDVCLLDTPYDVPTGAEASKLFNSYIPMNIKYTDSNNIFEYIEKCIILTVDLIKLQPFNDGNKRTFRALLNLMFKQAGIPPIYIKDEERENYKKELLDAICNKNYNGIIRFYHYKIADSIVSLDIYSKDNDMIYTSPVKKVKKH